MAKRRRCQEQQIRLQIIEEILTIPGYWTYGGQTLINRDDVIKEILRGKDSSNKTD